MTGTSCALKSSVSLNREKNVTINLIDYRTIGEDVVSQFESIGFINNGCNMTWSKTPLVDKYYKDVFGLFSFYKLKFF